MKEAFFQSQPTAIPSLSIILPCFNEEGNIERVLRDVAIKIRALHIPFEIIVVNDGSTDHSMEIITRIQQCNSYIRIVHHIENKGYGEALRSGFDAAHNEWILLMDADGQFDIKDLMKFLPFASNFDMILGFRTNRADPWYRSVLTILSNTIIQHLLFRMPLRDISCGFKLFRGSAWEAAQPIISTEQKLFIAEWLHNSVAANLKIKEFPVKHYPRRAGSAKGARLSVIFATIKPMGKLLVAKYSSSRRRIT